MQLLSGKKPCKLKKERKKRARDDIVWDEWTNLLKLPRLNVTPFLESFSRVDLGVWVLQWHRKVGTLSAFCWWVKGLPLCQPPAVKPWKQDRTETEKEGRPSQRENVIVWGILRAVSQTLSTDYQRPEREPCALRLPAFTPPRVSCPFLASERGGKSTSRAKYFHSEESPRGCLLLFLSAGADRKQWRLVF